MLRPFEIIQEKQLFLIGLFLLLLASIFAFLTHTRFDGVLDMHLTNHIQWYQPFLDNGINTLCLTLFFYLLSLLQPTKARIIDLLNVALICRIPLYFTLLTNIGGINKETTEYIVNHLDNPLAIKELPLINLLVLGGGALLALGALVIMGFLIYNGYKNATNAKKASHLVLLLVAVLAAEGVSKLLVYCY